jgi:hypothetical protein
MPVLDCVVPHAVVFDILPVSGLLPAVQEGLPIALYMSIVAIE